MSIASVISSSSMRGGNSVSASADKSVFSKSSGALSCALERLTAMVPGAILVDATDTCGAASCTIASITSNEAVNGKGDGNTAVDWEITGPNTANLRAERAGGASGRICTLTVRCTDRCGNALRGVKTAVVAH